MSPLERFDNLAAVARREPTPAPDVTAAVLARLPHRGPLAAAAWPAGLRGATIACASLSLVCGWLGWQVWSTLADPLGGWSWATCLGWLA